MSPFEVLLGFFHWVCVWCGLVGAYIRAVHSYVTCLDFSAICMEI